MNSTNSLFADEGSEIITKNTDIIKKAFASEIKSVDKENYIVHAIVSDDNIDRYDEVIKSGAWKNLSHYEKHPVLLSSHNYGSLNSQIGITEKVWVEGNKLHAKFKYFVGEGNQEADWGFKLAQKGAAAFSVGFIPLKHENKEIEGKTVKTYTSVELLEISQVLIPANASALQKGLDSDDPVMQLVAKGVKSVMDTEDEKWQITNEEITYMIKSPNEFQRRIFVKAPFRTYIKGIFGKTEKHSNVLQALHFPKDIWDLKSAKAWINKNPDISEFGAFMLKSKTDEDKESKIREDADNEIKYKIKDPDKFQSDSIPEYVLKSLLKFEPIFKQMATDAIKTFDKHVKNIEIKHKRKTEQGTLNNVSIQLNNIMKKYKEVHSA